MSEPTFRTQVGKNLYYLNPIFPTSNCINQGCWSLRGPPSVTGTVGGSQSVQCQYEEEFRETPKYWCKSPCVRRTLKTEGADREGRKDRVSIRDHPVNLTFTVTLENLTEDDAGTYWCGIDTSGKPGYLFDRTFQVVLSVTPGELCTPFCPHQHQGCLRLGLITPTLARKQWDVGTDTLPSLCPSYRSLLSSIHFLLLILLKVPLFLMMLSAVFWVNRPQWAICGHQSQPDEDNLQPSLPIHILSRDNTTQTRRGRTSGPRPVSSPLVAKNW
uniref:Ig-like domain-containing protein n=1 Tax=Neovison vison TaxID=452646 RepID=A0A8C7AQC5_NEOVI